MANIRQRRGLEIIFSIFLGILILAFVGVGVYTFHPPPREYESQINELYKRRSEILDSRLLVNVSPEEREQIRELDAQRDELTKASRLAQEQWGRSTSIILIVLATLAMAVSLIRADQLPVISSGLLLGGVLTMLYGVGWIITSDTAIGRFIVITVALLITLLLGYIRFVRRRSATRPMDTTVTADATGLVDIERRLTALEQRIDDAASALGQNHQ